MMQLLALNSQK